MKVKSGTVAIALSVTALVATQVSPLIADNEVVETPARNAPTQDEPVESASIITSSATYDPSTLTSFIPGTEFVPRSDAGDRAGYTSATCVFPDSTSTGNVTQGEVPVLLPNGALLESILIYFEDNDADFDIDFLLRREQFNDTFTFPEPNPDSVTQVAAETIASGSSAGITGPGQLFIDIDPDEETGSGFLSGGFLTFTDRFYSLDVTMRNSASTNHQFCGLKAFYKVPASGDNLTFTPLDPCAVFDSRPGQGGSGAFVSNETRTVTITGDTSAQGGAGDCGIDTRATSVQMNMLVLSPASGGSLKLWAAGDPEPNGVLAFSNEVSRWNNSAAVPISGGDQISIKMQNGTSADIRLVVTGYFSPVSNMGN